MGNSSGGRQPGRLIESGVVLADGSFGMMESIRRVMYGPILVAVLMWLFAGSEIYQRAVIDLDGTVIYSATSCMQPYNNRCGTTYLLRARDGSEQRYDAGPTDKSLRRRLPVGTVLMKKKWALSYAVNGREVRDFPLAFYAGVLGLGCVSAIWWCILIGRDWVRSGKMSDGLSR